MQQYFLNKYRSKTNSNKNIKSNTQISVLVNYSKHACNWDPGSVKILDWFQLWLSDRGEFMQLYVVSHSTKLQTSDVSLKTNNRSQSLTSTFVL